MDTCWGIALAFRIKVPVIKTLLLVLKGYKLVNDMWLAKLLYWISWGGDYNCIRA